MRESTGEAESWLGPWPMFHCETQREEAGGRRQEEREEEMGGEVAAMVWLFFKLILSNFFQREKKVHLTPHYMAISQNALILNWLLQNNNIRKPAINNKSRNPLPLGKYIYIYIM